VSESELSLEMIDPEYLKCVGFYGYGTAWVARKSGMPLENLRHDTGFCSICHLRTDCWQTLLASARNILPGEMEQFEHLQRDHDGKDVEAMWREHTGGIPSPPLAFMMNNTRDGVEGAFPGRSQNQLHEKRKERRQAEGRGQEPSEGDGHSSPPDRESREED